MELAVAVGCGILASAAVILSLRASDPFLLLSLAGILALMLLFRQSISDALNGWWLRRGSIVRPGHYIRVEGKQDVEGYVAHIGVRGTSIQTPHGDLERIPNSTLANSIFTNFHAPQGADAVLVDVDVDARSSPLTVQHLLEEEAEAAAKRQPGIVPGSHRLLALPGRFPGCRRHVLHCRAADARARDDLQADLAQRVRHRLHRNHIPTPSLVITDQESP